MSLLTAGWPATAQAAQPAPASAADPQARAQSLLNQMYGGIAPAPAVQHAAGLLASGLSRNQVAGQMAQASPDIRARIARGFEMPWYDTASRAPQASPAPTQQDALEALFQRYFGAPQPSPTSFGFSDH